VIDLGPADDGAARRKIGTALVAAGLDPILGEGLDDALAGLPSYRDDPTLAVAMADAKRAFGDLQCNAVIGSAEPAIALLATRQAAGIAAPELPRALAYVLLCADREGKTDQALLAASRLRTVGGSPDVPASVLAKYPEIDSVPDRELVELDVTTAEPGAALWVDFAQVGTTPAHVVLPAGEHIIAAASGTKRGYVIGTTTHKQKTIAIELSDMAGAWSGLAARVASWKGKVPPADELAQVLAQAKARVAILRHGDTIEV